MKPNNRKYLKELLNIANNKIQGIDMVAQIDEQRAYGGIIRATKGKLLEEMCKELVAIAWDEIGGDHMALSFSDKTIKIPLRKEYIKSIKSKEVREWIESNIRDFYFNAQVDIHVMINDKFVLGIECKAFTENAMLKRILVDFTLLKSQFPKLKCGLLQLESQLTGDYSEIDKKIIYGSHSSHTLMSYFDVDLNIMTLLKGERKVDAPIHKAQFFKPLLLENAEKVINRISELLLEFV
ncbi:MAG: hypothetical protein J6X32_05285 [Salinivirgaceae bacterium]|nr:hypothetical protein [Salinivirgaceae bacterium]